jgi:hypothetical protein
MAADGSRAENTDTHERMVSLLSGDLSSSFHKPASSRNRSRAGRCCHDEK